MISMMMELLIILGDVKFQLLEQKPRWVTKGKREQFRKDFIESSKRDDRRWGW